MPKPGSLPHQRAIVVLSATVVAVVVLAALYWAQIVFIPLAMGLFLSFLLSPVVRFLQKRGLGRIPAVIGAVTLATLLLGGTTWLMTRQVTALVSELPQHSGNIRAKVRSVQQWLNEKGGLDRVFGEIKEEWGGKRDSAPDTPAGTPPNPVRSQPEAPSWLSRLPGVLTPAVEVAGSLALAIVLAVFILLGREDLRNRFIRLVGNDNLTATTKAVDDAGARVSRFLLMQVIVNGTYGLALSVGLFLLGVDYALLWGFLAAVLRYIPYLGAWVAAILPIGLSLAQSEGWWQPLAVIGLFLVLELISNNLMEPWLYGHSIGVSEVALLVSAAFWAFLWGPIGMVLSAPLTVCLVVMGRYVPQLAFLDVLLGDEPVLDPDTTFYQRLLAKDQDEAALLVQVYCEQHPQQEVYDALLIPALVTTKLDYERDAIEERDCASILQSLREIVADLGDKPVEGGAGEELPRVKILCCPARDEKDELALTMLARVLDSSKWDVDVIGEDVLSGELFGLVEEKAPAVLCIGSLPPGGLSRTRLLCKKLRARFPELKILVGRWNPQDSAQDEAEELQNGGADQVATSLLETQSQLNALNPVLRGQEANVRVSVG